MELKRKQEEEDRKKREEEEKVIQVCSNPSNSCFTLVLNRCQSHILVYDYIIIIMKIISVKAGSNIRKILGFGAAIQDVSGSKHGLQGFHKGISVHQEHFQNSPFLQLCTNDIT